MSKRKNPQQRWSTDKIIGITLEVLGVLILVVNAILLNTEDTNLGMVAFLLFVGALLFFGGMAISRLPRPKK